MASLPHPGSEAEGIACCGTGDDHSNHLCLQATDFNLCQALSEVRNPMWCVLGVFPFHRWRKQRRSLNKLPKNTKTIGSEAGSELRQGGSFVFSLNHLIRFLSELESPRVHPPPPLILKMKTTRPREKEGSLLQCVGPWQSLG